jgi:hypothetical protein
MAHIGTSENGMTWLILVLRKMKALIRRAERGRCGEGENETEGNGTRIRDPFESFFLNPYSNSMLHYYGVILHALMLHITCTL